MPPRRNPVNFDQFEDADSGFVDSTEPEDSEEDQVVEFEAPQFVEVPLADPVDQEDQAEGVDQPGQAEGVDQPGQAEQVPEAPPELPLQLAESDQGNDYLLDKN